MINADDAPDNAAIFSSTAATAGARAIASVSALSAEVTAALAATGQALAIVNKSISATQLKQLAFTCLLLAGVDLGPELASATLLKNAEQRNKFKLRGGEQERVNIFGAVA